MDALVQLTGSKQTNKKSIRDILLLSLLDDFCVKNDIKNKKEIFDELNKQGIINTDFDQKKNDIRYKISEILKNITNVDNIIDINFNRFEKDYTDITMIGVGMYGDVFKASHLLDGREYAIKKINLIDTDIRVLREIRYFSQLFHPNLVRYHSSWLDYDIVIDEDNGEKEQHVPTIFIQMELCESSMKSWLINTKRNVDERYKCFNDIIKGLEYIHDNSMIHRDLKPANILWKDGRLKISDFGLSRLIADSDINTLTLDTKQTKMLIKYDTNNEKYQDGLTNNIGTELYSSPEQLNDEKYTYTTDIYSLGIIFFELCYPCKTNFERIDMIRKLRENKLNLNDIGIEKCDADLILKMINPKPDVRVSLNYIKKIILDKIKPA